MSRDLEPDPQSANSVHHVDPVGLNGTIRIGADSKITDLSTSAAKALRSPATDVVGEHLAHVLDFVASETQEHIPDLRTFLQHQWDSAKPVAIDGLLSDGRRFRVDEAALHGSPGEEPTLEIRLGPQIPARMGGSDDQDRLNPVAETAGIGGWELARQASTVRWTTETFRIHQLTPREPLLLKDTFECYVPEDRSRLEAALRRAFEYGAPYDLGLELVTAHGPPRHVRCHCIPVIVDGATVKLLGTFREITSQKREEDALKESEVKYRELFENNSAAKLVISPETGQIVEANPAAAAFYGYSLSELLSLRIHDINIADNAFVQDELKKSQSGANTEFEFRHRLASGEVKDVMAYTGPVTVAGQSFTHSVVVDISERKRAEQKLLRIQQLESLGTLAGGIAHDFNNVLTAIFGNISLAADTMTSNHPAHQFLTNAERALDRAAGLSQQLLTFSKGGTPTRENVGLEALLSEVVRFDLAGSNVRPVFDFDEGLQDVLVDPNQLQQVFSNLTVNANQAMPNGGTVHIGARNKTLTDHELPRMRAGQYVVVTFRDEGVGIPAEEMHRIFEPYYTTKPAGNGLGLATCHSIIQKHQGSIELASQPGRGTTFTILLPASTRADPQEQQQRNAGVLCEPESRRWRVLIMDDDVAILDVLTGILGKLVAEVVTCQNADEAAEIYGEEQQNGRRFALTILDLTIPGGRGGKVAAEEILKLDPGAVLVCSSGYTDERVMAEYRDYGFKGTIAKPYTLGAVRQAIESLQTPRARER